MSTGASESLLAVGLMSGTSMDGIDAALIRTDGHDLVAPLAFHSVAYDEPMRARLRGAIAAALTMERPAPHAEIDAVARDQTLAHAAAVKALLAQAGVAAADVALVGFHGQTIAHRPDRRWTWQIGDGALLARETGITVVHDFRCADVESGGQGAPLAPAYHRALVSGFRSQGPVAVLNLGGVGNITWFAGDDWGSFDTGPGNALIDDWVRAEAGLSHDAGGALAASGSVHEQVVAAMADLPWFDLAPPKSLDRHDFSLGAARGLSLADGAATLTAFTAVTVALALNHVPARPLRLLVCGGGRHNATLMAMLAARTGVQTLPVEAAGWNGDALEAEAFAYLGARTLMGLPISFPQTTGVAAPMCGGVISRP
ncbi:anhydro-N-acetylmuramic acid kinase [Polymorphobacter arshaanensis]|uniref:Anhydro-N-acetylmuramic acid kinase n=1 Tax=Glacieibacterium arshaanense TaxID=2511025 RepID=A0A4Y9EMQ8_9SPHN|nr:anhydro-N-acetylmuramic acid kinase [Polymorphobacter arshaanensis]TFU03308.1 anhydro-N-acetylmuramic acid kinase [Polymorphobacter arshaanensis]